MANPMSSLPLVTVICLCYNHQNYVLESINSVLAQSYTQIELIVVDDASTDNSQALISNFIKAHPQITFIPLETNLGNCTAFNKALAKANGKYIIDLAADDLLLPDRVLKQVETFENLSEEYAVVFTDAYLIDESGLKIKTFYKRDKAGKLIENVPTGDIYIHLIKRMILSSPTMMMRKKVLDELGGYDESLSYEDYDFWVRSGRKYKYFFLNEILTKKRVIAESQGAGFYKKRLNKHLISTLKICNKALELNKSKEENDALGISVSYHLKLAFLTENFEICEAYYSFLKSFKQPNWKDKSFRILAAFRVKVNAIYSLFLKLYRGIQV
ncbi:glycosyltransferase family 2 protein [Chondrinema litorale]|uniref:glycosyltransferase family 2 protein n=1 Tax=Chondrinema litorale TaxID=2994555 RepID=UPI00254362D5|nr:glycosyltransferase [Chondrinema litorale]UZR94159.1 glycosyltransferase [Chondrinema litorale]